MSDAGEHATPRTFPRIRGVSLSQYAGVQAGVAAGLPLADVLKKERVAPDAWQRAEDTWGERIAESVAGDGALYHAFDERFLAAQDRYERSIPPLDDDLGAWLDFVRRWSSAPDPLSELARLGLRASDVASLHRLWLKRINADPSLAAQMQAILQKEPGEAPVPSPGLSRAAEPPFDDSAAVEVDSGAAFDEPEARGLVEEGAELDEPMRMLQVPPLLVALPGDDDAPAPARPAPARPAPARPAAGQEKQRRAKRPADVASTGARPAKANQARATAEAVPPKQPPQPISPPSLSPEAMAAIMAVPDDFSGATTLPLAPSEQQRAAAKKSLPFQGTGVRAPAQPSARSQPRQGRPSSKKTLPPGDFEETRKSVLSPLPFQPGGAKQPVRGPAEQQPASPPVPRPTGVASLAETADLSVAQPFLELAKGVLPFESDSRAERAGAQKVPSMDSSARSEAPAAPVKTQGRGTRKTVAFDAVPDPAAALPFVSSTPLQASPPTRKPTPGQGLPFRSPPAEPGPAPVAASAPAARRASLTLEQYAQLCVELQRDPPRAAQIRAHYGLADEAAWMKVRWDWQERLKRDPALRERWMKLIAQ